LEKKPKDEQRAGASRRTCIKVKRSFRWIPKGAGGKGTDQKNPKPRDRLNGGGEFLRNPHRGELQKMDPRVGRGRKNIGENEMRGRSEGAKKLREKERKINAHRPDESS